MIAILASLLLGGTACTEATVAADEWRGLSRWLAEHCEDRECHAPAEEVRFFWARLGIIRAFTRSIADTFPLTSGTILPALEALRLANGLRNPRELRRATVGLASATGQVAGRECRR